MANKEHKKRLVKKIEIVFLFCSFILLTPVITFAQFVMPDTKDPIAEMLNFYTLSPENIFRWGMLAIIFLGIFQLLKNSKKTKQARSNKEIYLNILFSALFFLLISYAIYEAAYSYCPALCAYTFYTVIGKMIMWFGIFLYFIFFSMFQIDFWFRENKNSKWIYILLIISLTICSLGIGVEFYSRFSNI